MTATRQNRGAVVVPLNVRVAPELADWLREWARSQEPPVSLNIAAATAIETLKSGSDHR